MAYDVAGQSMQISSASGLVEIGCAKKKSFIVGVRVFSDLGKRFGPMFISASQAIRVIVAISGNRFSASRFVSISNLVWFREIAFESCPAIAEVVPVFFNALVVVCLRQWKLRPEYFLRRPSAL